MIVNKQACQVLQYWTSKYQKTDTFSTSAEISYLFWSGDILL